VEENMARDDRHGNREAKKPKKLKPKEIGSTLASIQKKALEAANSKKNSYDDSDLGASFLIKKRQELCRVGAIFRTGP
jgi:hypothetical protein